MRALKTIVIGLGILLVVGFGLLIYGLTQNWHRLAGTPRPGVAAESGWGDVMLRQPAGTRIRGLAAAGGHVVVQLGDGEGARERLVVLDPASGAVVGTFWIAEAP